MMNTHLSTTVDEVVPRPTQDRERDVRAHDAVDGDILHMADALPAGIVTQVPDRF